MKHYELLIFVILFLLAPLRTLAETIPLMIPHTGTIKVRDSGPFNGLGQFKFAITNGHKECASLPEPGSLCQFYWTNESSSPTSTKDPASFVTLPISNGIFTVRLGDVTLTDMQAIPAAIFENATTHLRVWFNDGTRGSQWLSPDRQLVSVPYAYHAETAKNVVSGGVTSAMIANNAVTTTQIADGTIGTDDLAFAPATSGELDTHKGSTDHDGRYLLKVNGIPTGMIAFFPGSCPASWSEYTSLQGRFVVGTPSGGTDTGVMETALTNLGTLAITTVPTHSHLVDPPSQTTSNDGSHTHGITDPGHIHRALQPWTGGGPGYSNGGSYGPIHNDSSVSVTGISINASSTHSHSVDISPFNSGSVGVNSVNVTPPYIQLRACQSP